MMAGIFADEPNLVITGWPQVLYVPVEVGYDGASQHLAFRIYIGHRMHQDMSVSHLYLIALLLKTD
jgi:hypothetical protein